MPGYNTGIGIGAAIAQLPSGILQGEEIQRRRANEDEQREMARQEFANRQAMFGRTQKQWTAEDIANELYAKKQAGQIGEEEFRRGMAEAGLGEKLYGYTQQQEEASMRKQQFAQNMEVGGMQLGEMKRVAKNRDISQAILGLEANAPSPEALSHITEAGKSSGFIGDKSKVVGITKSGKKNGIDVLDFVIDNGDGTKSKRQVDIELFGGALGLPELERVGTAQGNRWMHQQQINAHYADREDAKAAQAWESFHKDRQDQILVHSKALDSLKAIIAEKEKVRDTSTTLSTKTGVIVNGKEQTNRDRINAELAGLYARQEIAAKSMEAAAKGFAPVPYMTIGADGSFKPDVAHVRTVSPIDAKAGDKSRNIDYRFDDMAFFNNGNSTMLADAVMPNADKNDPTYKALVAKSANKWVIPVYSPSEGKYDLIYGGDNPALSKANLKAAHDKGFEPFVVNGIDYGHAWGAPDVGAARERLERFKVKSKTLSSGVYGGRTPIQ